MEQDENFFIGNNKVVEANDSLSEKSKRRLRQSKSENTIKAYDADWRDFLDWCKANEKAPLPTEPETIVNYINDLADNAKANTISRRVTAISENHIAAGFDAEYNPARSAMVRAAVAAIRREKGTFQQGKTPILVETLPLFADYLQGDSLQVLRDRALLFLGFAGAFRRSELVAVTVENLTFTSNGIVVFIPRAKTDQLGKGSTIGIPFAPNPEVCAARAVKTWIDRAGLKTGPLFRAFKKNGELRDAPLSDKSVALIVKKYAALAGFDADQFAGHSLRRGFATSAAQHNVSTLDIMRQTRHKSEKMVHRYIEQGSLFKDNPLDKMYRN